MVNLGSEFWDPTFIESPAPTPVRTVLETLPLFKEIQEGAKATPVKDRVPTVAGTPICARCRREPSEIPDFVDMAKAEGMPVDEYAKDDGTYNDEYNMFVCDVCYIAMGMPLLPAVTDYMSGIPYANPV